jgi:quercetin dioxygenase-like cupin family protein/uncharacterized membrane protein
VARAGAYVENPRRKEVVRFIRTAAETGGDVLEMLVEAEPGGPPPPLHSHPLQEERFEVISGHLAWRIGDSEGVATTGESAIVRPGVPHTWWNGGKEPLVMRGELRPALRFETFLETIYGLQRAGRTDSRGRPDPLQLAVIVREFRAEWVPEFLPEAVRQLALPVLGIAGRLLRRRWWYPEFSPEGPVRLPNEDGVRHHVLREVALAFLAPAVIVSVVGLLTRKPELRQAALTSIPLASAVGALGVAAYLARSRGRGVLRGRVSVSAALAVAGAAAGAAFTFALLGAFRMMLPSMGTASLQRLWIDIPLSAAIGAAISSWRLHPHVSPGLHAKSPTRRDGSLGA